MTSNSLKPFLPAMSSLSADSPMPILILNGPHIESLSPGIPVILLPSTPSTGCDAISNSVDSGVDKETKSIATTRQPMVIDNRPTSFNSSSVSDSVDIKPEYHSSTSYLSSQNTNSIASLPSIFANGRPESSVFDVTTVRHRRRAKMPGGPSLKCAVCGDAASR